MDLGLPNVIPPHVRAFRTGTDAQNPTGPETFQVCVMDTSAGFRGIIRDHVGIPLDLTEHTTTWIGYDFHELCPAPAVYYSPGIGEIQPVEGFDFTDVTLACNHPLGGSWARSSLLFGVQTTNSPCDEAAFKFDMIEETRANAVIQGSCNVGAPVPGGVPAGSTAGKDGRAPSVSPVSARARTGLFFRGTKEPSARPETGSSWEAAPSR